MPERPWWKRSNCISKSGSRTRRASRAGLRRIRGKTAAAEKGDKAHCPTPSMGNALCPLSVAPRTLSVAPTDSAHAPSHPLSVACLPKETRHPAACCVPRTVALSSALSAPLSALRSQRCALSAALSSSRSPPLPAMTTTYAPRAARVCLPALNLSQRT